MPRSDRLGAAYALLWASHDVADHVIAQTDHQAARKADPGPAGWRALAGHVGLYHAAQLAAVVALRAAGVRPSLARTAAAVALSASTHAFFDRRWPVRWLLEHTGSRGFAASGIVPVQAVDLPAPGASNLGFVRPHPLPLHGPALADQALHHVAIAAAAWILAGGDRRSTRKASPCP